MSISIEIKNFDKLRNLADKYPAVSERYVNDALGSSMDFVKALMLSAAPVGLTRNLRTQWQIDKGRFQAKITSVAADKRGRHYGADIEYGRGPHLVPFDEIAPWAEWKGLNPYAVQRSIAKKGTAAQPFFYSTLDKYKPGISNIMRGAVKNITNELTK